jgi:hypothetical protein
MQKLALYRIVSWILLFIGAFFSFIVISALLVALGNPVMLFGIFILACVVMYSYSSWRFLTKGIDGKMVCAASLKQMIKANGFGALLFATLCLLQSVTFIANPALLNDAMAQAAAMQGTSAEQVMPIMQKAIKLFMYFLGIYSAVLLIHVFSTFKLVKQYHEIFEAK